MAIELGEMIERLRQELTEAMREGEGSELLFETRPDRAGTCHSVGKEGGPTAKIKSWVAEVRADTKLSSTSTQKIKLTLEPRRRGQPDANPMISGQ